MTFLDYMKKKGNKTFKELPFNELDGTVLIALSYIRFEEVFKKLPITFNDITTRFLSFDRKKRDKYYFYMHDEEFVNLLSKCERYKNLEVIDMLTYFNKKAKTQFFAFATRIGNHEIAVTYRGTDQTLLGWYESLSLGYDEYVGGQKRSKEFLKNLMKKYPFDRFYIVGHSKGGNYALYAASMQNPINQLRIIKVLNYDGPMLLDSTRKKSNFSHIKKKVITYLPNASIVGTCLGNVVNPKIVDADFTGLAQHVYYFWKIKGNHFKKGHQTFTSKVFAKKFPKWLSSLSPSKLRAYVKILYSWVEKANIKTIYDFINIEKIYKLISLMVNEPDKKAKEFGDQLLILAKLLFNLE